MARIHHRSLTTLTLLTTGFLSGCTFDGGGIDDVGVGGVGGYPVGAGGSETTTGGASAGGGFSTGGASTGGASGCEGPVPPITVSCAGYYFESSRAGRTVGALTAELGPLACGGVDYGTGGWIGTGGSVGVGGSPAGGGGWGGAVEEEPPYEYDEAGTGGFGADGGCGDECGAGGSLATGGATGSGGAAGGSGSDWCDGLGWNDFIGGVSFGVGACQATELALPLVFDEPYGFYHLRVYAGGVACERGTLLTEIAGFGTGATLSLPVSLSGDGFVSLELTGDGYTELAFGLTPLGAVGNFGSE